MIKDDYIGAKIMNSLGECLGIIHEVMLDNISTQVAYVILHSEYSFGKKANQYLILNIDWIKYDTNNNYFILIEK